MKNSQTTLLTRSPVRIPATPPKQSAALFLTALHQTTKLKRIQRVFTLVILLLMTVRSFCASYTVTLEGSGTLNPIALQLDLPGGNTLQNMLPSVPDGTVALFWDCATEDFGAAVPTYSSAIGQWDQNPTLTVGQGFFLVNAGSDITVTITGNPITPSSPAMPCGCGHSYFIANQTPNIATWESIVGAPPVSGSKFIRFDEFIFDWVTNTFTGCTWSGGIPSTGVGESVRIYIPCSGSPCSTVTFSLGGLYPNIVGDCGSSTIRIIGAGIQSGAVVTLKKTGESPLIPISTTVLASGSVMDATFSFTGAVVGAWDVEVTNPGGSPQTIIGGLHIGTILTKASPNSVGQCNPMTISASGLAICPSSTFKLVKGAAVLHGAAVVVNSSGTKISGDFDLTSAPPGTWDVVVTSPAGNIQTLAGALTVSAPTITSVSPANALNCGTFTLAASTKGICSITSFHLTKAGESPRIGTGISMNPFGLGVSAVFNMTSAAVGSVWNAVITTGSGTVLTLPNAVTVTAFAASPTVVVPNTGGNCGIITLTIGGSGFQNASVELVRSGHSSISGVIVQRGNASLEAQFNLNGAALGAWDVVATVAGCGSWILPGAFTVQPVAISLITPVCGKVCQSSSIQIQGSCFASGATVTLRQGASSISTVSTFVHSRLINSTFTPTATGVWDVEVVNPGGATATLVGKYTVLPCTGCDVDVTMNLQSRVGAGRSAYGSISYVNNGITTLSSVAISVSDIPADAVINLLGAWPAGVISSPVGLPQTISATIPTLTPGQIGSYFFYLTFPSVRTTVQLTGKVTSPCNNTHIAQIEVVASHDPNDKFGLVGNGDNHHMLGTETLPYEIVFENKASASAPAQEVFVTDKLDPNLLDLSTFSLGTVTFGSHTVVAPPGLSSWTTYVPYAVNAVPADDIVVKIVCALVTNPVDPNYGKLTWSLLSLDPATGLLPADPLRGFLPPNTTSPNGEGSVTYTVQAKTSLVTGDVIGNNASIVFDLNPPILTPVWVNIIDKTAPVSSVTALPALQAATSFTVNWSGSDAGSGIASYDVFVSDNNAPFTAWLSGATTTSGTFNGVGGHTYRFYSVAKDGVGHIEASPVSPDATTMVRPWLTLTRSGNNVIVAWEGAGGTLQETGDLNETWTDIVGATSPYVTVMYPTNHFYRLRP